MEAICKLNSQKYWPLKAEQRILATAFILRLLKNKSAKEQAESFTSIVNRRNNTTSRVVNVYDFDERKITDLSILKFSNADESWLDFVIANRRGECKGKKHDIIIGAVANDDVISPYNYSREVFITSSKRLRI